MENRFLWVAPKDLFVFVEYEKVLDAVGHKVY